MRSSLSFAAALALVPGAVSGVGPLRIDPQPLQSPECGCALEHRVEFWNPVFTPPLLVQAPGDDASAVVRLDGADRVMAQAAGTFDLWGAPCGTPVNIRFEDGRYTAWFAGFVTRTCYGTDGCEYFGFRGRLSVVRDDGARIARPVTGSCGC